jgi:hypothetical protein
VGVLPAVGKAETAVLRINPGVHALGAAAGLVAVTVGPGAATGANAVDADLGVITCYFLTGIPQAPPVEAPELAQGGDRFISTHPFVACAQARVDHQVALFAVVGGRLVADTPAFSAVFLIGLDPDLAAGVRVLVTVGKVVIAAALGLPTAHVEAAGVPALAAMVQGILQVGLAAFRQPVAVTERSDAGVHQAYRRLALGPGIVQHTQPPALAAVLRVVLDVGATAVAVMKTLAAIALAFPCFADLAGFAGLLAAAAMFMITRSVDATGSTLLEPFFASLHAGAQLTQPAVRTLD